MTVTREFSVVYGQKWPKQNILPTTFSLQWKTLKDCM